MDDPGMQDDFASLVQEITRDAHGEEEQLWAFIRAFEDNVILPADGFVLGEPVSVIGIGYDGNMRRGLTATCRKEDDTEHVISLADIGFPVGEPARYLAAYRKWVGLDPHCLSSFPRKKHRASEEDIDISRPLDLIVLNVKERAARCRIPGTVRIITFRSRDVWRTAPGEILTVRPGKYWRFSGNSYISGEVASRRIDIPALGLTPLRLEESGMWDPAREKWGEEYDPTPECVKPIIARGPRPLFRMELALPGSDPKNPFADPISRSKEMKAVGDLDQAYHLLMETAEEDLRCLDVHSNLGDLAFQRWPQDALRHYEIGLRIGELSLWRSFEGVLPWSFPSNRPYLRCLYGYGLCLWRLKCFSEAGKIFERLLWLNPSDDQYVRLIVDDVKACKIWEDRMQNR